MEGPRPGLSGDGLVEAAGKLALASGRCRRGCDAAILCAPPLAACQFFCGTGYTILSIYQFICFFRIRFWGSFLFRILWLLSNITFT